MRHYRIERTNDIPLEFDGEVLADLTSEHDTPGQRRWTEHRIYRTSTDVYVVETVGRSINDGEIDRRNAVVLGDPKDIPAALKAPRTYLTLLARDTLDQANFRDPKVPTTEKV